MWLQAEEALLLINNYVHSFTNYLYNQQVCLPCLSTKGKYNYSRDQNGYITGIAGPGGDNRAIIMINFD